MRKELDVNLKKSKHLTPEQKEEFKQLALEDLETIKERLAKKIETLLVENADIDYSRSALRRRMPQIVEEGVNAISKLTQDVKATLRQESEGDSSITDTYLVERDRKTLSSQDRSSVVNLIGGEFKEVENNMPRGTSARAENSLPATEIQKPDTTTLKAEASLNVSSTGDSTACSNAKAVISEANIRQLKAITRALNGAAPELKIVGYGNMSKADLVKALTASDRLAFYDQNPDVVKAESFSQAPTAALTKANGESIKIKEKRS